MEICSSILVMFVLCVHCTKSVSNSGDRNLWTMSHIEHTLAVRVCFVLKSSTSHYEFLYTQSVFIDFNEPIVHRYIVVRGCCKF